MASSSLLSVREEGDIPDSPRSSINETGSQSPLIGGLSLAEHASRESKPTYRWDKSLLNQLKQANSSPLSEKELKDLLRTVPKLPWALKLHKVSPALASKLTAEQKSLANTLCTELQRVLQKPLLAAAAICNEAAVLTSELESTESGVPTFLQEGLRALSSLSEVMVTLQLNALATVVQRLQKDPVLKAINGTSLSESAAFDDKFHDIDDPAFLEALESSYRRNKMLARLSSQRSSSYQPNSRNSRPFRGRDQQSRGFAGRPRFSPYRPTVVTRNQLQQHRSGFSSSFNSGPSSGYSSAPQNQPPSNGGSGNGQRFRQGGRQ